MITLNKQYSVDFEPGESADPAMLGPSHHELIRMKESCRVELPAPDAPGRYVLLVTITPTAAAAQPEPVVVIRATGQLIHESRIRFGTVLAAPFDWPGSSGHSTLDLAFEQPNWGATACEHCLLISNLTLLRAEHLERTREATPMPPTNDRITGTELSDSALMKRFASLGDNCEFGLVQRRFGAEALDLLRFARVSLPSLEQMFGCGLAGLDAPENMRLELRDTSIGKREFILCQQRYNIESHPWIFEGEQAGWHVFLREHRRVSFLSRLLLDDIRQGSRILVFKQNAGIRADDVERLFRLIRGYGPSWLLWVDQAGYGANGSVDLLRPGFVRGFIDRFAAYKNVNDSNAAAWLTICRQAYAIWQENQ